MIVTAHQLNFLPGLSVIGKIAEADAVIWLDTCQYTRHDWINRNRFTDGAWMTVPVTGSYEQPINTVRIADPGGRARAKIARKLVLELGAAGEPFAAELRREYELLVGLNKALIDQMLAALDIEVEQHFQSHLDTADPDVPHRSRYAGMAYQLGATTWLSGPCRAFDEEPFDALGIDIQVFEHDGPNPCALELLKRKAPVKAPFVPSHPETASKSPSARSSAGSPPAGRLPSPRGRCAPSSPGGTSG